MFADSGRARRTRVPRQPVDADGPTLAPASSTPETTGSGPTALYVTGPRGGGRYLVHAGALIRIGRGPDSTIFVDDPRVSRLHVALHLSEPVGISDLGSANGTFVGPDRLASGESRPLSLGEAFFIGDSALVLRPSGLVPPPTERVVTLEDLPARLSSLPTGASGEGEASAAGTVVLKVRPERPSEGPWIEAVLGELMTGAHDWIVRLGSAEIAVGLAASSVVDTVSFERKALQRLGSWSIAAAMESTFLPRSDAAPSLGLKFLRGSHVVAAPGGRIIVCDPAMESLMRALSRAAPAPISALVLGETGVGKDVVASMLHELSARKDKPFVRLNCASFPEALLETELFGHEKGAFTGAFRTKIGLLESADGGTVFLDEIGDLALALQAKLLRAIESCEITRVGGVTPRRIDVRFVAATNRNLEVEVAGGHFRLDLYHRLNGVTFTVPPLRQRPSEIEPMARQFLESACVRFQIPHAEFSPDSIAALQAHAWPGNVRELRNVIERAVVLADDVELKPHHLGLPFTDVGVERNGQAPPIRATTVTAPEEPGPAEPPAIGSSGVSIEEALARCGGNQTRAARFLGIPRRTLVRRIGKMGLPRPRKPDTK